MIRWSVWVWNRKLIEDDTAVDEFLGMAESHGVDRVYFYVMNMFDERRESLRQFVQRSASHGVAVWGLLGEPEWCTGCDRSNYVRNLQGMAAFNAVGPKLAGVKLDLEPHTDRLWHSDAQVRAERNATVVEMVVEARRELPDVEVWVDVPRFYFYRHLAFVEAIAEHAHGLTLMGYTADPDRFYNNASGVLKMWRRSLLEIGMELNPNGSAESSLAYRTPLEISALIQRMHSDFVGFPNFFGIAIHELNGLRHLDHGSDKPKRSVEKT